MNAIYRCRARDGCVVEVDADTMDSVEVIKGLAKIVHHVVVEEVEHEIVLPPGSHDADLTRLPDELRAFIDKRAPQHQHLVSPFAAYAIKNKIDPSGYEFLFDAMVERDLEEESEYVEQFIANRLALVERELEQEGRDEE